MPRRRAVTREQLEVLLALPATETELIRHWTLGAADLAAIERRRGDPNQLGFALQLCAFRYPGRLLRPREAIPELALGFVAGQLGVAHDALATYAVRVQTRREQLGALRAEFGFRTSAATRPGLAGHRRRRRLAAARPRGVEIPLGRRLSRHGPRIGGGGAGDRLDQGSGAFHRHSRRLLPRHGRQSQGRRIAPRTHGVGAAARL